MSDNEDDYKSKHMTNIIPITVYVSKSDLNKSLSVPLISKELQKKILEENGYINDNMSEEIIKKIIEKKNIDVKSVKIKDIRNNSGCHFGINVPSTEKLHRSPFEDMDLYTYIIQPYELLGENGEENVILKMKKQRVDKEGLNAWKEAKKTMEKSNDKYRTLCYYPDFSKVLLQHKAIKEKKIKLQQLNTESGPVVEMEGCHHEALDNYFKEIEKSCEDIDGFGMTIVALGTKEYLETSEDDNDRKYMIKFKAVLKYLIQ